MRETNKRHFSANKHLYHLRKTPQPSDLGENVYDKSTFHE